MNSLTRTQTSFIQTLIAAQLLSAPVRIINLNLSRVFACQKHIQGRIDCSALLKTNNLYCHLMKQ